MTEEKVIVLVSDKGDGNHGEITVLEDPHKAERLVEALLEAGFEQDRIHVFTGRAHDFQVSHRPVVALVDDEEAEAPAPAPARQAASVQRASRAEAPVVAKAVASEDAPEGEPEPVEVAAGASEDGEPVRFSSLFRSA